MKIYTKTGDKGMIGLLTGERIDKDSMRVEAYGNIDELNSSLGLARAFCVKSEVKETIYKIQKLLMLVMAELASTDGSAYIKSEHISLLEETMDHFDGKLPKLTEFLIPGDKPGSAALDLARTTTRRAERQVLRLSKQEKIGSDLMIVLNRLSDLCFVLLRVENM